MTTHTSISTLSNRGGEQRKKQGRRRPSRRLTAFAIGLALTVLATTTGASAATQNEDEFGTVTVTVGADNGVKTVFSAKMVYGGGSFSYFNGSTSKHRETFTLSKNEKRSIQSITLELHNDNDPAAKGKDVNLLIHEVRVDGKDQTHNVSCAERRSHCLRRAKDATWVLPWNNVLYTFSDFYPTAGPQLPPSVYLQMAGDAYLPAGSQTSVTGFRMHDGRNQHKYKIFERHLLFTKPECIVAFRGTDTSDLDDLLTDGSSLLPAGPLFPEAHEPAVFTMSLSAQNFYEDNRTGPNPPPGRLNRYPTVFRGFRDRVAFSYNDVKSQLNSLGCREVSVTGHSLGGAAAQVFGAWFSHDTSTSMTFKDMYSFNSPQVAPYETSEYFTSSWHRYKESGGAWQNYCRELDAVENLVPGSRISRLTIEPTTLKGFYPACDRLAQPKIYGYPKLDNHDIEHWGEDEL